MQFKKILLNISKILMNVTFMLARLKIQLHPFALKRAKATSRNVNHPHFIQIFFGYISLILISNASFAQNEFYCAQNHAYINIGMTRSQVQSACGTPTDIQSSGNSVNQQIPVTQLIYTSINKGAVFFYPGIDRVYSLFSLPSGSVGNTVEVNLINNQVATIKINGETTNALSVCKEGKVQIGDNINAVFNACGAPDNINNTYVNRPVPKSQNPEVWNYAPQNYQPGFTLTFINGILKSIQSN